MPHNGCRKLLIMMRKCNLSEANENNIQASKFLKSQHHKAQSQLKELGVHIKCFSFLISVSRSLFPTTDLPRLRTHLRHTTSIQSLFRRQKCKQYCSRDNHLLNLNSTTQQTANNDKLSARELPTNCSQTHKTQICWIFVCVCEAPSVMQ